MVVGEELKDIGRAIVNYSLDIPKSRYCYQFSHDGLVPPIGRAHSVHLKICLGKRPASSC